MKNRTYVSRLFDMKDMKAMVIALAWLLPISVVLTFIIWTSGIKSASLQTISLESAIYAVAILTITATIWLLVPGLLFILCLIADGIRATHSKLSTLRNPNGSTS